MKKTLVIALFFALASTAAYADASQASSDAGSKISNFFKKLNPAPFLQNQERKYKERKQTSQNAYLGKDTK